MFTNTRAPSRPTTVASLPALPAQAPADGEACDLVHVNPARVRQLRDRLIDVVSVGGLADTFRLLGDPTRVRILDALSKSELCVCDLAAVLDLGQSAVSHQLRLLRGMRLVRSRRAGRMVFYALDDQHIVDLFEQGLRHIEETSGSTRHWRNDAGADRRAARGARPSGRPR